MAKTKINLIIIDACRSQMRGFGTERGLNDNKLAQSLAPLGSYIAYATSPGKTAKDGSGSNGLYTSCLLKHIRTEGITVETVFKRVRQCVIDIQGTTFGQLPWENSALTGGDFYFLPSLK